MQCNGGLAPHDALSARKVPEVPGPEQANPVSNVASVTLTLSAWSDPCPLLPSIATFVPRVCGRIGHAAAQ